MLRRILLGVTSALAMFGGLVLYPGSTFAASTTLQICVIQHPGDSCPANEPPPSPPPPTPPPATNNNPGGGGGFTGNSTASSPPLAFNPTSGEVYFSGIAYPLSSVTLVRDGQFLAKTTAGPDARFQFDVSGVTPGTYTYSVWSEDSRGIRSISSSFSVAVAAGVGTVISGIYLPPTIDVDKSQVKRGDPITFLGRSNPGAQVSILVHSNKELVKSAPADKSGVWKYVLDTLELDYGSHEASARAKDTSGISPLSAAVSFVVGDTTTVKAPQKKAPPPTADLSGDGRVNIADFSILSYWYKRPLTTAGTKADLNHDGKVDLRDFSILAYYWNS